MEEIPSTGLQVKDLLMKWSESNDLLKSIHFDINEDMCVGGILAIGIIHKVVTGPFWRLVETVPDALSLNTHLHQMKIHLEHWSRDSSPVLNGECMFENNISRNS